VPERKELPRTKIFLFSPALPYLRFAAYAAVLYFLGGKAEALLSSLDPESSSWSSKILFFDYYAGFTPASAIVPLIDCCRAWCLLAFSLGFRGAAVVFKEDGVVFRNDVIGLSETRVSYSDVKSAETSSPWYLALLGCGSVRLSSGPCYDASLESVFAPRRLVEELYARKRSYEEARLEMTHFSKNEECSYSESRKSATSAQAEQSASAL